MLVERRQIVAPGDPLAEGDYVAGANTYKEHHKIYAQKLGLVDFEGRTIYVVALKGRYIPTAGDLVIGIVVDVGLNGWYVDINAPYDASLSVSDVLGRSFGPKVEALTNILKLGDVIIAKVLAFDRTRDPSLTIRGPDLGPVGRGVIIDLTPPKIPRLIGKKGSMISMLKQKSGCDIVVGQNGRVLIRGDQPKMIELLISAINMVEKESHRSGLTDKIKDMFEKEKV
ncbi:MAG: exosome complex RNA-binding protein Rrp4 [Candidatus Bathyarchaeia archaeon]